MKFLFSLAFVTGLSSAALAAPCDDTDALARARATQNTLLQLFGTTPGVNSVRISNECGAYWIEQTLGRPYPKNVPLPACGVVVGFDDKAAAVEAAKYLSVYPGLLSARVCGKISGSR